MEKILLAVNAINLKKNALDFACYLARLTKSRLTGVFLENEIAAMAPVLGNVHGMLYDGQNDEEDCTYEDKMKLINANISDFEEGCIQGEVPFNITCHRGFPSNDLLKETQFADLLVVDADTSFNDRFEGCPTEFVHELLIKSACPVIIAPERFNGVDELVFVYSGSISSLFAIKQFTYLFPQLFNKKVTVVQVSQSGKWDHHDKDKLMGWLSEHYYSVNFEYLFQETNAALISLLTAKKNIFIILSSYEKFGIVQYAKNSPTDLLIKTVMKPIFITSL
ncbi:MAG: hypothetical protein ABIN94_01300 [Ferruginibacter sp.]